MKKFYSTKLFPKFSVILGMLLLTLVFSIETQAQCVLDILKPVPLCQVTKTIYLDPTGVVQLDAIDIDAGSFDLCGIETYEINNAPSITLDCSDIGLLPTGLFLVVTDTAGNADSCLSLVTVLDTTSPKAICHASVEVFLDGSCSFNLASALVDSLSSDNCQISSFSASPNSFDDSNLGPQQVQLTVTDASGNSNSCTSMVNVKDTTKPILTCPSTLIGVSLDANGLAIIDPAQLGIPVADNCPVTWNVNGQLLDTFDCTDIGQVIPIQISAYDNAGNQDVCGVNIEISDNTLPNAQCALPALVTVAIGAGGTVPFPEAQAVGTSSDNCGISSVLINGQSSLNLTCNDVGIYPYTATVSDASGNSATCQSLIDVLWGPSCGFAVQVDSLGVSLCGGPLCTGYVSLSTNGGLLPISYLWSDSSTLPVRVGLCPGEYFVVATDNSGATDTVHFTIGNSPGCVWPGDTDDDAMANNFDLLPIALAYGTTGLIRPLASINWQGEIGLNWNIITSLIGLPDFKHIDCNGDALVDSNDVQAIDLNYAQSYLRGAMALPNAHGSVDPPLYVDCDTISGRDSICCMGIFLGTEANPAVDAYALAYTINYDPLLVSGASISYPSSWFGASSETIEVHKDFPPDGKIETGIGRTDHQAVTGSGRIGTVCFTIRDDILKRRANPDTTVMPITINNVRYVDEEGHEMPVSSYTGCLTIVETLTGIENLTAAAGIKVYPNPTNGTLTIEAFDLELENILIQTVTGQTVKTIEPSKQGPLKVDLQDLENGIYILHIQTNNGFVNKKMIMSRP